MASRKPKVKSPKKTAAVPADSKLRAAPAQKVRVRMYRQGLGDCFLVTFNEGTEEAHMLIDCGTLGSKGGASMADVLANIRTVTGGRLKLVVATHEHKDHVSGFSDPDDFIGMTVDHVWMAWTENPTDDLAKKLKKYKDDLAMTVTAAAQALKAADDEKAAATVESVLGFEGLAAGKFAKTIDKAMKFVQSGLGGKTRYLEPGDTVEEDWLPGFRFYVLGPPRSEEAIRDTGEHHSHDLYGVAPGVKVGVMKAAGELSNPGEDELEMPFDSRFRMAEGDPLLARSLEPYRDAANAWRRIDSDWLHGAADLALQLDNMTNNTSLALAIERVSDGKILLFPADAQQGHWLSWHHAELKWKVNRTADSPEIDAANLLKRTVFYKVGHHGSHNATAKAKGLELMTSKEELVAFIPVDREIALGRSPKGTWKMPARELYRTLLTKCDGRVARSDIGWAEDAAKAKKQEIEKEFAGMADDVAWARWDLSQKKANVTVTDLYIDFRLE